MTTYKLAPVRWELGQILLPEHFTTLHTSLLAELRARAAVAGLPAYGVAELSWHDKALEQGQLILQSLTAVLPSGLLINVPGSGTLEGLVA
jgi:type VI secretion system protein ImpJ